MYMSRLSQSEDSEGTFAVFEPSCHLLQSV